MVAEPVSLTNIETMLRNARAFRELSPAEEKWWARMLEQCNVAVTLGNKLSVFSAMVTFPQVKTSKRMTNKSFDAMLATFRKSFPGASELPHTYNKNEEFPRAVGIGETLYQEDHGATLKHKCGKRIVTLPLLSISLVYYYFFGPLFFMAFLSFFCFFEELFSHGTML